MGGGPGIQDFEVVCKLGLGAYAGVYKVRLCQPDTHGKLGVLCACVRRAQASPAQLSGCSLLLHESENRLMRSIDRLTRSNCFHSHARTWHGPHGQAVRRADGRTYAIKRVKLEGLEQQDLAMTLNEVRFVPVPILCSLCIPLPTYHRLFPLFIGPINSRSGCWRPSGTRASCGCTRRSWTAAGTRATRCTCAW